MTVADKARARLLQAPAKQNDADVVVTLQRDCGISVKPVRRTESGESTLMHIDLRATANALSDRAWACVRALRVTAEDITIDEALTRLGTDVIPNTQETPEEADARYENLRDRLRDYPPDVVKAACAEAGTVFKFMPAWAELKGVCDDHNRFREFLYSAMQRLKPALPAEEHEPLTADHRRLQAEKIRLMKIAMANGDDTTVEEITAQARANIAAQTAPQPKGTNDEERI